MIWTGFFGVYWYVLVLDIRSIQTRRAFAKLTKKVTKTLL